MATPTQAALRTTSERWVTFGESMTPAEVDYSELDRFMARTMDEFKRKLPALQATYAAERQHEAAALARETRRSARRAAGRRLLSRAFATLCAAGSVATIVGTLRLFGLI